MFEVSILTTTTGLTQNEFDTLLHFVSPEKQKRIKQFILFQDAQNCLLGDILVRVAICHFTELNMQQLEFAVNPYGKPFLINDPHIHFNISHAGYYVTCVVANEPVGIDIEIIKPIELRIAERFFTSEEVAYIMSSEHMKRFYEIWTKKESRIKLEGKGLLKSLSSFSVLESNQYERFAYHNILNNNEATCYVCSTKQAAPLVRTWSIDKILSLF